MRQGIERCRFELFGIQSWVALSANDEETKPHFVYYGAHEIPVLDDERKSYASSLAQCWERRLP